MIQLLPFPYLIEILQEREEIRAQTLNAAVNWIVRGRGTVRALEVGAVCRKNNNIKEQQVQAVALESGVEEVAMAGGRGGRGRGRLCFGGCEISLDRTSGNAGFHH